MERCESPASCPGVTAFDADFDLSEKLIRQCQSVFRHAAIVVELLPIRQGRGEISDLCFDRPVRPRLERWMRPPDDPLLAGGVIPAPETAVVNDPDDLTPNGPTRPVTPRPVG